MSLIDETLEDGKRNGGGSWPIEKHTLACVRWALERLGQRVVERVRLLAKEGYRAGEIPAELERNLGLPSSAICIRCGHTKPCPTHSKGL